jgi:hypothetical protein
MAKFTSKIPIGEVVYLRIAREPIHFYLLGHFHTDADLPATAGNVLLNG